MAFPILMTSAGKVPPPIVMGSLQLKGGLKFCFHMTEHIKIAFNLDNQAKLKPVLSDSHS